MQLPNSPEKIKLTILVIWVLISTNRYYCFRGGKNATVKLVLHSENFTLLGQLSHKLKHFSMFSFLYTFNWNLQELKYGGSPLINQGFINHLDY